MVNMIYYNGLLTSPSPFVKCSNAPNVPKVITETLARHCARHGDDFTPIPVKVKPIYLII